MCCVATLVTLALVIVEVGCGIQFADPRTPKTLIERLRESVNVTFVNLYDIKTMYGRLRKGARNVFVEVLKDGEGYSTLANIIEVKIDRLRFVTTELLNLERKAVACRGLRHLLPMIAYGICIDRKTRGPTANRDRGEREVFDELFATKFSNSELSIGIGTTGSGNTAADENERSAETTLMDYISLIETTLAAIQPFAERFDLPEIEQAWTGANSRHGYYLSSIFRDVEMTYGTQCFPGADAAWFLGARNADNVSRDELTVPELIAEIERLHGRIRSDLELLSVKFHAVNAGILDMSDVSIVYHHATNKYYNPAVWELIGDERLVNGWTGLRDGSYEAVALNDVYAKTVTEIEDTANDIIVSTRTAPQCHCYLYVNMLIKLYYYVVLWLAENVTKINETLVSANSDRFDGESSILDEFPEMKYEIDELAVDGRPRVGDPTDPEHVRLLSTVDQLNRETTGFGNVAVFYTNLAVGYVRTAVEKIDSYLYESEVSARLYPLIADLKRTANVLNRETVEVLTEWYARGVRTRDLLGCFPAESYAVEGTSTDHRLLSLFDVNIIKVLFMNPLYGVTKEPGKVSLKWMLSTMDSLNGSLKSYLKIRKSYKFITFC